MEASTDFLNLLDFDISLKILTYLEDPSDLVRVSSVSQSWRNFVIANGLWKQLCLRMFPQLSRVAHVIGLNKCRATEPVEAGSSYSKEWESLERNDRGYALLARACTSFIVRDCISKAISASSTDHCPEESIDNTLVALRASYWSSKGQSNPEVPERLTYKLADDFCVITEINIRPFKAYFQRGEPIYSAKAVRFRMGHPKGPTDVGNDLLGDLSPGSADDKFIWTYTSQEFPMAQESRLQKFKLPEPVLCVGGILQIELLGRVQRQEMDGLFYTCMSYVQVMGRMLSPTFGVEILEPSGKFVLEIKNNTLVEFKPQSNIPSADQLVRRFRDLQHIAYIGHILQGNVVVDMDEFETGEEEANLP
ncbi:hypothetical protein F2P56_014275 [Juglans regia]|uniref:F-box protein At4g00755-like n=2 Tax=Juglans regia TaxID=51240 RepID=A0A2I4DQZ6_JUGRE|nr:F-box protein At4g00755-like [Juglans regia]XP_018809570.1 F-box protein At4g00755-like [Juglans regia]XP_018809571.1 F-box protein At4g00755-like [Juglans regia]XP_018809572.1 F-box protein At4g00755-like [Juglans regia]XP_035548274.1 F-box protein At4g00755-like [Juglans regia]KAF5464181.1 hypothetical protein F2P56_014275 [Juglans regia]